MTGSVSAPVRRLSRWQASALHLLISAAIAAVAIALMLAVWYPPPLFTGEGGSGILIILVAVDVVIGPLITLVIFKSGKPGLRFDLSVIALLQFAALAYGCHVMFVARPVFIAFVVDQFETVRAVELDPAELANARYPEFRSLPLTGPVLAAVEPPGEQNERMTRMLEALGGGNDLRHYPRYYVPYRDYRPLVIGKSRPLDKARERDKDIAELIGKYVADSGSNASTLRYVPLRMKLGWGAALINPSGDVVKLLGPSL